MAGLYFFVTLLLQKVFLFVCLDATKVNMVRDYCIIEESPALHGTVVLDGAKNAVLAIMASLVLTSGRSKLTNVPASSDVYQMIQLLSDLGATVVFDEAEKTLFVDTSLLEKWSVCPAIMKKMRASILVMGPLLARFGKAQVALPGGCLIGTRPIDLHLKAFSRMGTHVEIIGEYLHALVPQLKAQRFILDYPSVGATENIMMAAVLTEGVTEIVNAAIEPEVLDLIDVLKKMGAQISLEAPATICIEGVKTLQPIEHAVMADRLEAGTLLLAAAISRGSIKLPNAPASSMELFLQKLQDMGHQISIGAQGYGVELKAALRAKPISFKTMPHPGFPTDLQAPMMAALSLAEGVSVIHETVFENRMLHVRELQKMGAQITVNGNTATVRGVDELYGAHVIATDIRAAAGLIIAGLVAKGTTTMTGIHHMLRGYSQLDEKLRALGASVTLRKDDKPFVEPGFRARRPQDQ